jgi:hypothetical protein
MNLKISMLLPLLLSSVLADASYTCSGGVQGVGIEPSTGVIFAEGIGPLEWTKLCSVSKTLNNIEPESCKVIYSTLLTAQTTGKQVRLWFNDGKNCSKESHAPWYELKGWYFGPVLEE